MAGKKELIYNIQDAVNKSINLRANKQTTKPVAHRYHKRPSTSKPLSVEPQIIKI